MNVRSFQGVTIVTLSIAVLGCGSNTADHGHEHEQEAIHAATDPHDHDHDHLAEGPHGGHLIEMGQNEITAELVFHDEQHEVVVHLSAAAESPMPAGKPVVDIQLFEDGQFIDYPLNPVDADEGAVFSLQDEKAHRILDAGHVKGRLRVTWGGKEYSAPLDGICHGH